MTVTDRIFQNVAELSVPNFFITVEFSVMGNEMPEHIEAFLQEKYEAILRDRKNLDAITRKGFDLHFMDSEGKISNWGYSGIKDRESALQRFHEYHEMDPDKYARAIIRDNMTRKEKTYA